MMAFIWLVNTQTGWLNGKQFRLVCDGLWVYVYVCEWLRNSEFDINARTIGWDVFLGRYVWFGVGKQSTGDHNRLGLDLGATSESRSEPNFEFLNALDSQTGRLVEPQRSKSANQSRWLDRHVHSIHHHSIPNCLDQTVTDPTLIEFPWKHLHNRT